MKLHGLRHWIDRHRIASALGAALLLVILLMVAARYGAMWRLADYKKQLVAQGEMLTIPELVPSYSSVSNGGPPLVKVVGFIPYTWHEPQAMRLIEPGVARVAWQEPMLFEMPPPTGGPIASSAEGTVSIVSNLWPLLEEGWQDSEKAFSDLRAAARSPEIFFEVKYSEGYRALLPHLAKLKSASRILSTSALYHLHRHEGKAAVEDVCLALSVAEHFHEPIMISQLVRYAMAGLQFNATWEALQSDDWTDAQLQQLQASWEQLEFVRDADAALAMERAMGLNELEFARGSYSHLHNAGGALPSGAFDEFVEIGKNVVENPIDGLKAMGSRYPGYWWWCWAWTYDDERALIHFWQDYRTELQAARKSGSFSKGLKLFDHTGWKFDGITYEDMDSTHYMLTKMVTGSGFGFSTRIAGIEVQRGMAIAAIALKRFHLREKKYPAHLEELVPQYCHELPRDAFDGQPLRYARKEDGSFLLYSIGMDGIDNHGDPRPEETSTRPSWVRGRDQVWPRAATVEEGVAFREKEIATASKSQLIAPLRATNQIPVTNK